MYRRVYGKHLRIDLYDVRVIFFNRLACFALYEVIENTTLFRSRNINTVPGFQLFTTFFFILRHTVIFLWKLRYFGYKSYGHKELRVLNQKSPEESLLNVLTTGKILVLVFFIFFFFLFYGPLKCIILLDRRLPPTIYRTRYTRSTLFIPNAPLVFSRLRIYVRRGRYGSLTRLHLVSQSVCPFSTRVVLRHFLVDN